MKKKCLQHWETLADPLTQVTVGVSAVLSLGMFLTPLLLHFICKRHVAQMYFDPDTRVGCN
jgi:hypothetical protein